MKMQLPIIISLLMAGTMLTGNQSHFDGPYVSYSSDKVFVKYIVEENAQKTVRIDSISISDKKTVSLWVNTDVPGEKFEVKLKDQLVTEPAEHAMPSKQFILSDIEGNFGAFRSLLQNNGVIDSAFNWTFGSGHLVLTGDFVDRGEQVNEVLWLIYALEDKAKAAGGYVHYVLGNHEIMIMSGDVRYVNPKYKETAGLLNTSYAALFDENAELGRWLRTKNIMEKIGENLFIHAGVSETINDLRVKIDNINTLARPYYSDTIFKYEDRRSKSIMGDDGPFWYRGYYTNKDLNAMGDVVSKTLSKFKVNHIFTGHSIVADNISAWYAGRVINTDVHHSQGKSEAVLIEDGKYYRVNPKSEKFPLEVK